MKKILVVLILTLALIGSVNAAKPAACATIQGGTLTDTLGNPITVGTDTWGYNYQANIFNGWYDNYARPVTPATGGDWLQMKWNTAWLSSVDCDNDGKLDRHYGFPAYIGSGAWLTNHASGQYQGSGWVFSNLTGQYVMSFVLGGTYDHDLFLTNTAGVLSGNGGYPASGPYSYTWDITTGAVSGNTLSFDAVYTGGPDAVGVVMHVTGTIQPDGTVSGAWNDNYSGGYREGTWSATGMTVKETCYWDDFVKIVAVPASAVSVADAPSCPVLYGLEEKMWYTSAGGAQIGCSIWGEFAVIQDVYNDACGEKQYAQAYHSPFKSGLGNW